MIVQSENKCASFTANDGCRIKELLHPQRLNLIEKGIKLDFSLAIAEVDIGKATYRHRLAQHEVYLILNGKGRVHIDDEVSPVASGDAVLIPGGSVQWIENTSDEILKFAALVNPPWTSEGDQRLD